MNRFIFVFLTAILFLTACPPVSAEGATKEEEAVLIAARDLIKQKKPDEARKILKDAIRKEPEFIGYVSYLALLEAQEKNYEEALSLLDGETRRRGETQAGLLVIKTRIAAQMPAEDAAAVLQSVEEAAENLPQNARLAVMRQLGPAWLMIGDMENTKRVFETLAELEPENVPAKIQLFDLARKLGNEPEMDRLTEFFKESADEDSAEYLYCRATKIIWLFSQEKVTKEELAEAKTLLEKVKEMRPDWPNAVRGLAEVALMEGNYDATIRHLQRVDELGALTMQQLELLVKLLYREGRNAELKELMEKKKGMLPTVDLVYPRKEPTSSDVDAVPLTSAEDYLWAGNIAFREKYYQKAEEHFRKTMELAPRNSVGWLALLQVLKAQDAERETLEKIVAEMRETLPEEKLPLAEAKARMFLGDTDAAETAFLKALEMYPKDLEILFNLCNLYLNSENPRRAAPHLEKMAAIIKADFNTSDYRLLKERLAWVREMQAKIAAGGE